MKTAVEIYTYLPKTNCGKCGTASCFGFAARLASRMASAADCPNLSDSAREALRDDDAHGARGTVYEQALAVLKERIKTVDFGRAATSFGADQAGPDVLTIAFLNGQFRVTEERIVDESGAEPRPWISILIYNHLCMPDPPPPSGEWVSFSAIPAAHAKDKAWHGHVEEVIARHFSGNTEGLKSACSALGGVPADIRGNHDAAFLFRFFPHYPVLLLFSDAVPEENFPAQCTVLLDRNAPHYLDIESMVVLGEEFAGRLTES
jgi:hypothetical protein